MPPCPLSILFFLVMTRLWKNSLQPSSPYLTGRWSGCWLFHHSSDGNHLHPSRLCLPWKEDWSCLHKERVHRWSQSKYSQAWGLWSLAAHPWWPAWWSSWTWDCSPLEEGTYASEKLPLGAPQPFALGRRRQAPLLLNACWPVSPV